jgi:hypothetical protein
MVGIERVGSSQGVRGGIDKENREELVATWTVLKTKSESRWIYIVIDFFKDPGLTTNNFFVCCQMIA